MSPWVSIKSETVGFFCVRWPVATLTARSGRVCDERLSENLAGVASAVSSVLRSLLSEVSSIAFVYSVCRMDSVPASSRHACLPQNASGKPCRSPRGKGL